MITEEIALRVCDAILKARLIQVEVSAKHVHLTEEHIEVLFGKDAKLIEKRELSQPGQYLSEQRVILVGPKGRIERTAVLGPARIATQVELSKSDCVALGIQAPLRESGDVANSAPITLEGSSGSITIKEGTIIAQSHLHLTPETATIMGLSDKEKVDVELLTERALVLKNVVTRVSSKFRDRMHVDFDEANAALVSGFTLGQIIKR